ncbi:hypothetical protein HBDW_25950 [Herbaspirillum sp. DW155]|uniref:hypothetical protein n=1 Tax=Herbaspirillum sp. DW155 TaxID=3095609 RepID=UPI00308B80B2|nr:hypothetical protein HBDW_25950 [Herbaspirillum sp. DW155]
MKRLAIKQPMAEVIPMTATVPSEACRAEPEKLAALAKELSYDGPLSASGLEDGIRFYQRRTVEALLELGKRLILLKEVTPHGEFQKRIDLLGFGYRSAASFMNAARKTIKSETVALLATQVKSTKAFLELITHDDDVLEQLADLDDIDRMSASQLRERVRKLEADGHEDARAEQKRANRLALELEQKDDLLDRLRTAVPGNSAYTPETNIVRQQAALMDTHCASAMSLLDKMAGELDADEADPQQYQAQLHSLWFAAQAIQARAAILIQRLGDIDQMPALAEVSQFMPGMLTQEEATWFLQEVEILRSSLLHAHQCVRDEAHARTPRKPGRPKGAKKSSSKE